MDIHDNIGNVAPIYGCYTESDKVPDYENDGRKVINYNTLSSICKSLKTQQLKLLHKRIIDIANELYRFSDELDMSDKEESNCKISIFEAIKELNHITEFLTKRTLGDTDV